MYLDDVVKQELEKLNLNNQCGIEVEDEDEDFVNVIVSYKMEHYDDEEKLMSILDDYVAKLSNNMLNKRYRVDNPYDVSSSGENTSEKKLSYKCWNIDWDWGYKREPDVVELMFSFNN